MDPLRELGLRYARELGITPLAANERHPLGWMTVSRRTGSSQVAVDAPPVVVDLEEERDAAASLGTEPR